MLWKRRNKKGRFLCQKCGKTHEELPALAFTSPDSYDSLSEEDKANIAEISEDFCIINYPEQTDRFIRTTMTIQINDDCENLDYGLWVSVSEKTFNEYKSEFKNNIEGRAYFGRICNDLVDYEESTLGLHVNVETKTGGIRPELIPHQSDHKLISDWEKGISINEAKRRIKRMMKNIGQ